jgi:membrane-associated protease RseP (regulator of RpoE activity)
MSTDDRDNAEQVKEPEGGLGHSVPLPRMEDVGRKEYTLQVLDRYVIPSMLLLLGASLVMLAPEFAVFIGVTLFLLSPCVLIHEWGHYVVARRAGLEVKEFSIGMGNRVWTRTSKKTGVRWSLKALPVGGSVSVAGMTVEEVEKDGTDRSRAYIYAPIKTRLRLSLAGVFLNFLLAILTFTIISLILGIQRGEPPLLALIGAPLAGLMVFGSLVAMTVHALWTVATTLGTGGDVSSILTAPTTIQDGLIAATDSGVSPFLYYAMIFAGLNISLAVLNSLPFYMLDGGHAFTATVDGVRKMRLRRTGNVQKFSPLPAERFSLFNRVTGFALFGFIAIIYGRDIVQLFTGSL